MLNHPDSSRQKQLLPEQLQKAYLPEPPVDVLLLDGTDVIDFLHRMSTNEVRDLVEATGKTTIFTNEKGRIIDVVDLYYLNGSVHVVYSREAKDAIKHIFGKYVIMEDISVSDYSEYTCILGLDGSTGSKEVFSGEAGSIEMSSPRIFPGGKLFYIHKDKTGKFDLIKNGKPVDMTTFNSLRLELGIPLPGSDYDESVNPLESNLQQFINWTKGCYIGQEVIARLDTYQKIKRFLKGIVLDAILPDEVIDRINSNAIELNVTTENNSPAGRVTSIGYSPNLQTSIAMARFEKGKETTGNRVKLSIGDSQYSGKIVDLPFIKGENG